MEINYLGANSISIVLKGAVLVSNPYWDEYGLQAPKKTPDVVLISDKEAEVDSKPTSKDGSFVIGIPGEYEVRDFGIIGIPVGTSNESEVEGEEEATDTPSGTCFRIGADGLNIGLISRATRVLTEEQQEILGVVDILVIPVGDNEGIDALKAAKIVRTLDPKIVIPTYYVDNKTTYKQGNVGALDQFLQEMSGVEHETMATLKIKNGHIADKMQIVELAA